MHWPGVEARRLDATMLRASEGEDAEASLCVPTLMLPDGYADRAPKGRPGAPSKGSTETDLWLSSCTIPKPNLTTPTTTARNDGGRI